MSSTQPPRYNAGTLCDAWYEGGFCSCGAFHDAAERAREERESQMRAAVAKLNRHPLVEVARNVAAERVVRQGGITQLNAYQEHAMCTSGDNGHPPECEHSKWVMIAALGLAGEAGEVADLIKKLYEQDREFRRDELVKELGDVLWYVARLAAIEDISLQEVANANLEKLRKRYPNGFEPGGGVR